MKEFKVGERVMAYGCGQEKGRPTGSCMNYLPGTITKNWTEGVDVELDIGGIYSFHPKQLRRLKTKRKTNFTNCKARRVWLDSVAFNCLLTEKSSGDVWVSRSEMPRSVEFRECLPGEVVITKQSLAKAFRENLSVAVSKANYEAFEKALGVA